MIEEIRGCRCLVSRTTWEGEDAWMITFCSLLLIVEIIDDQEAMAAKQEAIGRAALVLEHLHLMMGGYA